MKRLDLTDDDASELDAALTRELHGLRTELAAAEDRAFRANLRARLDRLEGIAARLSESIRHPPASSATAQR